MKKHLQDQILYVYMYTKVHVCISFCYQSQSEIRDQGLPLIRATPMVKRSEAVMVLITASQY